MLNGISKVDNKQLPFGSNDPPQDFCNPFSIIPLEFADDTGVDSIHAPRTPCEHLYFVFKFGHRFQSLEFLQCNRNPEENTVRMTEEILNGFDIRFFEECSQSFRLRDDIVHMLFYILRILGHPHLYDGGMMGREDFRDVEIWSADKKQAGRCCAERLKENFHFSFPRSITNCCSICFVETVEDEK